MEKVSRLECGNQRFGGGFGLASFLTDSGLHLLEFLDGRGLACLRRSLQLGSIAQEAKKAELRAIVLELLISTSFPFTHAAYVLGLNGSYYSSDTTAEKHYGIPKLLPALVCELFRISMPEVAFTTIRIQRFAASLNSGGKHKTLAFSLSSSSQDDPGNQVESSLPPLPLGHVLCLTTSCRGGHGEFCADVENGEWEHLAAPESLPRFAPFPGGAWLRWHWPQAGDLYAITVTCETPENCACLRRIDRRQMLDVGFLMPEVGAEARAEDEGSACNELEGGSPIDASDRAAGCDLTEESLPPSASPRQSATRVRAAKKLLGLGDVVTPTMREVEEAFRSQARVVHPDHHASAESSTLRVLRVGEARVPGAPDRPPAARGETSGWRMEQLTWARRVLRNEAAESFGANEGLEGSGEVLALIAPAEEEEDDL